jgi:hypothetical protein
MRSVSGVSEEVCAFVGLEGFKGGGDGGFERVEGTGGGFAQVCLELGEAILDRIEVGTVGRQKDQARPGGFDGFTDAGALWAGRLSIMTISPGLRIGTSISSHQARKASPSMGAVEQHRCAQTAQGQAADKGSGFQCPCGTGARQRMPFGAQPHRRAIFVDRPLSSTKINRWGSSSGWPSNQAGRAAFTSARSCSLA